MTPLDLTQTPPRSPWKELRGVVMVPRMIDIARAELSRGNVGGYQIGRGMSALVLTALGMSVAEFTEIVRNANGENDVADHLWDTKAISLEALGARLRRITVADVPSDLLSEFRQMYGANLPLDRLVFDVLDTDDAATFRK